MTQVQQNNIQDLDDLAAQVEELVGELSEACEKVSKRLSDDNSEEEDAAPEDRAEAAAPAESPDAETDEDSASVREPHPAEQAIDELEQQLEDLIDAGAQDDTDEAGAGDTVSKADADEADKAATVSGSRSGSGGGAAAAIDADDIDDLDKQIAELTDELLDGDFTDAEGQPVGEAFEPPAQPASRATDKQAEPEQPEAEPAPESVSESPIDEAEAQSESLAAPASEAAEAEADAEPEAAIAKETPAPRPSPAQRAHARAAATPAKGPHPFVLVLLRVADKADTGARTLADLLATPLKNKPKIVRDTVGWFGLWTLFLAVCVWITLAFFRSPDHPEAEGEPMRIRTADESSSPPANQRPLPHPENVRSAASPR